MGTDPIGAVGEHFRHGSAGVVFRLLTGIDGGQDLLQMLRIVVGQRNYIVHFHFGFGDSAGFIHAQHIHPGQGLDTVHILDQNLVLGQLQSRSGHGNAGQQVQALGDHAYQRGDHALGAFPEALTPYPESLVKQRCANGDQGNAHHPNQPIQRAHHFGFGCMGVGLRFRGQAGRKGIATYPGQLGSGRAGNDKAAGFQFVTGALHNGIFLTGDQRFIDLDLAAADDAVGTDLVAGHKFHDIVPDQQVGTHFYHLAFPNSPDLLGRHQSQPVYRPFCPDLLITADDCIADDDDQEGDILHGRACNQQDHRHDHEHQVKECQGILE